MSQCLITTYLPIFSVIIWVLFECSHKKLELTPAVPLVKGPKHLDVASNVKAPSKSLKISLQREESEPKPTAAPLRSGRTQASQTVPILPSDDTTKNVESLPESSA
ncbi:hypothetical protein LOAG_12142 [Loa loa]|uniref:Uncharacterized protein n=1 Tax=Loa loa TaxID=7209 RepID=A0A1S0TLU6_LOALO|nr:hypothetical protein LOAG_12142 [Loa loa]EFO16365.1 hypothetical protein LOAG_12142 [Loa loa]